MTLPVYPNQIAMNQVNTELGFAWNRQTSLGESSVRTLAGVASGQIAFSNLHGKSAYTNIYGVGYNLAPNNADLNPYYYCMQTQWVQCPLTVSLNTGWITIYGSGGYPSKWVSGWTHLSGTALDNGEASGVLVRFTKNPVGRGTWYTSTYRVYLTDGTSTGYVDITMTFSYDFETEF